MSGIPSNAGSPRPSDSTTRLASPFLPVIGIVFSSSGSPPVQPTNTRRASPGSEPRSRPPRCWSSCGRRSTIRSPGSGHGSRPGRLPRVPANHPVGVEPLLGLKLAADRLIALVVGPVHGDRPPPSLHPRLPLTYVVALHRRRLLQRPAGPRRDRLTRPRQSEVGIRALGYALAD